MTEEKPLLYDYFKSTAEVLLSKYKQSGQQGASSNKGRNRELFVEEFLRKVLPPRLSVGSGEIWDSKKNKTGQLDIIILRDDAPCLHHYGSAEVYLAEGVFSVLEIKSNLTREKLRKAGNILAKVANLDRSSSAQITVGQNIGRPLRIVFAYEGAEWETLIEEIKENGWGELFDLICILNRGVLINKNEWLKWPGDYQVSIINGKAAALAFLYGFLTTFGASFVGMSFDIAAYFGNPNSWAEKNS